MAYIGKNPRLKSIVSEGDTLANLTAEPRVAGRLVYATDQQAFYFDDGSALTEVGSGGGSGIPLLSKGSLLTSNGTTNGEYIGADGEILVWDSTQPEGIRTEPLEPVNLAIPALDVDWSAADVFYKDVVADSTFTFSNDNNGQTIIVIVNNTDASDRTMTFPTALADAGFTGTVTAGTESVFTFVKSNSKVYVSEAKGLS